MSFIANFVCPKQYVTMVKIGTTLSPLGKKAVLCGSGELGKEVAIELQRYGRRSRRAGTGYANAPAMQVAHRSYVLSMARRGAVARRHREGKARLHHSRDRGDRHGYAAGIGKGRLQRDPDGPGHPPHDESRRHPPAGCEELGIPTSPYRFASDYEEFVEAVGRSGRLAS